MTTDDLESRLSDLEDRYRTAATVSVLAVGDGGEWPDDVDESDIMHRTEEPGINSDEPIVFEEPIIPKYLPPEHRGGIVILSPAEIARIYDHMPPDVRERELEYRIEHGEPIPAVLQE